MTDQIHLITEQPPRRQPPREQPARGERVRSHAHALHVLTDEAYLAYARVEAEKLYQSLVKKRWPQLS